MSGVDRSSDIVDGVKLSVSAVSVWVPARLMAVKELSPIMVPREKPC